LFYFLNKLTSLIDFDIVFSIFRGLGHVKGHAFSGILADFFLLLPRELLFEKYGKHE